MRAGLILLLFQPESIQRTTRCGGLPLRNTHTWLQACTHTHTNTLSNECTHGAVCKIREATTKTGEDTHGDSHSWTEAQKQTHNPSYQACSEGLSQNWWITHTQTSLLEPLNVSFVLFEDTQAARVPSSNITSLWCLGSEHWSLLVAAAYLFAFMQI